MNVGTNHGSSPRMWGTRISSHLALNLYRFIPTDVGNTSSPCSSQTHNPVHPHGCGEHACIVILEYFIAGSSPRMWGTRVTRRHIHPQSRFIPTDVGNTKSCQTRVSAQPVHPHGCGEHIDNITQDCWSCGSSPRMWGTQSRDCPSGEEERFIPTDVGNTPF